MVFGEIKEININWESQYQADEKLNAMYFVLFLFHHIFSVQIYVYTATYKLQWH